MCKRRVTSQPENSFDYVHTDAKCYNSVQTLMKYNSCKLVHLQMGATVVGGGGNFDTDE